MEQGHPPPPSLGWWWRLPTRWCRIQRRLINWRGRPCRTCAVLVVTIQMIWCVAFTSCRLCCALCVSLAATVVSLKLKDVALSTSKGAHLWQQLTASWELMDSGQDSRSSLGPEISESFRLFLQETSSFKQQNPGKFCLLVCSVCTFFAVLGRYIPGVVISYILVLGLFLWPLLSSPEFLMWLKPVLQKLDFGVGDLLHRIKENHEKRLLQSQGEKENIEADLSSMFPKLDSTVCKEMCVSDTDVSDVTWTDNGTFNLSEGHTPQTENSEDLDKEEAFSGGLPDFPSLDNGLSNGDDSDLSIGLPTPPPAPSSNQAPPPPPPETAEAALELVQQMASDAIAAAVTSAIQERIEAAVVAAVASADDLPPERRSRSRPRPQDVQATSLTPFDLAEEESDSEVEDFELLDQSELEQLEEELLGRGGAGAEHKKKKEEKEVDPASSGKPPSSPSAGFFSKLLGRH